MPVWTGCHGPKAHVGPFHIWTGRKTFFHTVFQNQCTILAYKSFLVTQWVREALVFMEFSDDSKYISPFSRGCGNWMAVHATLKDKWSDYLLSLRNNKTNITICHMSFLMSIAANNNLGTCVHVEQFNRFNSRVTIRWHSWELYKYTWLLDDEDYRACLFQ